MAYGLGMKSNSGKNGLNRQIIAQNDEVVIELQIVSLQIVEEIFWITMLCLEGEEGCQNCLVRNYNPTGCFRQKDLFLQGHLMAGL